MKLQKTSLCNLRKSLCEIDRRMERRYNTILISNEISSKVRTWTSIGGRMASMCCHSPRFVRNVWTDTYPWPVPRSPAMRADSSREYRGRGALIFVFSFLSLLLNWSFCQLSLLRTARSDRSALNPLQASVPDTRLQEARTASSKVSHFANFVILLLYYCVIFWPFAIDFTLM